MENKITFAKDFFGLEILTEGPDAAKAVTKLAKDHKMFPLASHQGVKYYITKSKSDLDLFKTAVALAFARE